MATHKTNSIMLTIADAFSRAQCEAEELEQEMSEWRDNMEEKLSHTEKYERVSEAASALENLTGSLCDEPPEQVADLTVPVTVYVYGRRGLPRWARLSDVASCLDAAANAVADIIDWVDEALDGDPEEVAADDEDKLRDFREELDQLRDSMVEAIGESDNVEFPGMYG